MVVIRTKPEKKPESDVEMEEPTADLTDIRRTSLCIIQDDMPDAEDCTPVGTAPYNTKELCCRPIQQHHQCRWQH